MNGLQLNEVLNHRLGLRYKGNDKAKGNEKKETKQKLEEEFFESRNGKRREQRNTREKKTKKTYPIASRI